MSSSSMAVAEKMCQGSPLKRLARRITPPSVWTRLRLAKLRRHVANFQHRTVRHSYSGFEFTVELPDGMAQGWYDQDWAALPEMGLLQSGKLKPGARVFDLGAHQCVYAMVIARIVGESGFVLAVEGSAHNAAAGRQNIRLNGIENLTVTHAVVAEKPGRMAFNEGLNGRVDDGSGAWGRTVVQAVSIDQLAQAHGFPDVLFLDVEGYETAALKGARETLARRPDCFVEVHTGHGLEAFGSSIEEVVSFFPESIYRRQVWSEIVPEVLDYQPGLPVLRDRFYLVATARKEVV